MPFPLGGIGQSIPLPQALYPTELVNSPYDLWSNYNALAAGDTLMLPAGNWWVDAGSYCLVQYKDPVNNTWVIHPASATGQSPIYVKSDGANFRVANLLGCPVGGSVHSPGNGSYVQASTTIAVTGGGGSLWTPIVGGALTAPSATSAGAGYGVAPIIFIPAPGGPSNNPNGVGGVQASAYATIQNGTVQAVSMTNPGAGYLGSAGASGTIMGIALPSPTDPNLAIGITNATIRFSVGAPGSLTAALCTNPGAPLATPNNITLTVSGAGASGTITPAMLQTVITASIIGGSTLSTSGSINALVTSAGGGWPSSTFTNSPEYNNNLARPRPANLTASIAAVGVLPAGTITQISAATGQILDGGMFFSVPTPILVSAGGYIIAATGTVVGSSTITFTMGSRPDNVRITPAP